MMTNTLIPAAVIVEMRSWLADLTFVDLASDDVRDASVVSDAEVIDAVVRLYAGGTSAFVLTEDLAAAAAGVSDAQLLLQLAVVLDGQAGPVLDLRLSTLVAHVCHAHVPAPAADVRAEYLTMLLADFLHSRHVLREVQVSPAGLDAWAATAAPVFVLTAVRACGRSVGGGLR
jgi:hypothetical protein